MAAGTPSVLRRPSEAGGEMSRAVGSGSWAGLRVEATISSMREIAWEDT